MTENRKDLPVFLTPVEVAQMIRMTPRSFEVMRLDGRGPPYMRLGKGGRAKVIYNLNDVLAWIEKHRNG